MKRAELKRTTPLVSKQPMARTAFKSRAAPSARKKLPDGRTNGLKTRQRAVTVEEKLLWNRLATEIGCIACMKDGEFNPHVSIHHVDGRTKQGCHQLVLPLCAPHHQHDDTDPAQRIGVHPWSARFEAKYGDQRDLVAQCMTILERSKRA